MSFRRLLMARLIFALSAMLVVGVGAVALFQALLFKDFFVQTATKTYEDRTQLMTSQMSGGVKWGKAASVDKVYVSLLEDPEAALSGVLVMDGEMTVLADRMDEGSADLDLRAVVDSVTAEMGEDMLRSQMVGGTLVTVARITDKKSGEPIGVGALSWEVGASIAAIDQVRNIALAVSAAVIVAVAAVMFLLLRGLALRPLDGLRQAMTRLAEGEMDAEAPHRDREDEIGAMANTVEVFRQNALKIEALRAEQAEADRRAAEEEAARQEAEVAAKLKEQELARAEEETARKREDEARAARDAAEEEATRQRRAARAEDEARHKEMMTRLRDSFGVLVEGAKKGEFSHRITANFDDQELNELATGLNLVAETVETGLGETKRALAKVAACDLSARINGRFEGAFHDLTAGVNGTIDTLSEMLSSLQSSSHSLREETAQLSNGFSDLSQRTSSQAASIEETSAAIRMLSESVQQNAARAEQAKTRADDVRVRAEDGGAVMGEANKAMDRVAQSSQKISDIVGLIDSISFQTNLLSLNASVEAARAGDAGAGFAVVAAEVRKLAQSAADASADIRNLINEAGQDVEKGVDLVSRASEALESIVAGVGEMTGHIADISQDAASQASQLQEVTSAVGQIDETTQQNAALVESSHDTLKTANQEVAQIDDIAAQFTLSGETARRDELAA